MGATWGHPVFNHDGKWHVHFGSPPFEFDSSWAGKPPPFEDCEKEIDVDDFCNDLNACAEFEKGLNPSRWTDYATALRRICGESDPESRATISATALQRCRAFVAIMEGTK